MRKLTMDICDIQENVLCNLYDNQTQVSGQAANVVIRTERNGWKELSFSLPSVCESEDGIEDNYRLDYLIADLRIRVTDDYETDWYYISEPRIIHNKQAKVVEVTANHISALLKTKNYGLEFSDEEGNNVGTCLDLLTTILAGTGWSPGMVTMFMEDDDYTKEKQRSLQSAAKSGAFKLIADLCDLFGAKPVYHGGTKTVDILPMNPFTHMVTMPTEDNPRLVCGKVVDYEEGTIPPYAEASPNLELHYDKYIHGITRTINTENIATKLTAYGSLEDTQLGNCTLLDAVHTEYTFTTEETINEGDLIRIVLENRPRYYMAKTEIPAGSSLLLSTLDALSMSYLYDGTNAHRIVYHPEKNATVVDLENPTEETKKNWFSYLYDFTYYDQSGLVTDEMIQAAAEYQRRVPVAIEASYEAQKAMADEKTRLSEIGESNVGFLKLALSDSKPWEPTRSGYLRLNIDKTKGDPNKKNEGVLYRSDYAEQARNYFTWYVAEKLKEDGTPVDNLGSVIYAIQPRGANNPPRWKMMYLRSIDDKRDTRTDIYGKVIEKFANFSYADNKERPEYLTLFCTYREFANTFLTDPNYPVSEYPIQFFLFGANSMTGMLGSLQSGDEAILDTLKSTTKVVTDTHPVVFVEAGNTMPTCTDITSTYAWCYQYYPMDMQRTGDLYFYCFGFFSQSKWNPVVIGDVLPELTSGEKYFYNNRMKVLYRTPATGEDPCEKNGGWYKLESVEEKRMAQDFAKVLYYCRKRDRMYQGLYEKYTYNIPFGGTLPAGNYAIKTPYNFCWLFTTELIDASVIGTEQIALTAQAFEEDPDDLGYKSKKYGSSQYGIDVTAGAWYSYDFEDEVRLDFYTITAATGKETRVSQAFYKGEGSFQMPNVHHIVICRETLPKGTETLTAKENCSLWVDTSNNVVYQENDISKVVEAQAKSYDTLTFPVDNILEGVNFSAGSVNDRGVETSSNDYQRSYNIDVYRGTTYRYNLPVGSIIAFYDSNKYHTRNIAVESAEGTFATTTSEGFVKVVKPVVKQEEESEPVEDTSYIQVDGYLNKVYANDKLYEFLDATGEGGLKGINNLMSLFVETANNVYENLLPAALEAQDSVKDNENDLSEAFGDLYRESWWQTDEYVAGDEQKLYHDALRNLKAIAQPEVTYDIDFIDCYGTEEEDDELPYPDITIDYAAHLIDPELDINLWAYIDELDKCYDKPQETALKINTSLSDIGQHSFTDVMSYIADVAKVTKANQSVYARAANLSPDGQLSTAKLNGVISTLSNQLSGANSNWYTDEKGNIVIESQDGLNAMMLTGMGFMVSDSKNRDGGWNWRSFGTGGGFTADEITGGTINGELIRARTINASQVVSNFGQQIDIASNSSLLLYATVDGVQPAGGLDTALPGAGDSYVRIKAGTTDETTHEYSPACIELATGGQMNVYSGSGINIKTGGLFTLDSDKFNIYEDGSVRIDGEVIANKGYIAGFTIGYHEVVDQGITTVDRRYLYAGLDLTEGTGPDSVTSTNPGVYLGTDGINIVNQNGIGFQATSDGTIYASGEGMIAGFAMSHTNLNVKTLGASSFTEYTEGTEPDVVTRYKTENIKIDPGVWYRVETPIKIRIDFLTTQGVLISSTKVDENTNVMTPSNAYYAVVSCDAPPANVPVKLSRYIRYLYAGTDTDPNHDTICVDSSTNGIYFGDDGLRIGSGITVKANGDAEFAGKVTADTGEIAGLTLGYDNSGSTMRSYMYSGPTSISSTTKGIYIGTDGINIGGGKFVATAAGDVTVKGSGEFSGKISATSGDIGGWTIDSYGIGNNSFGLNAATIGLSQDSGYDAFWAGGINGKEGSAKFRVTQDGILYATGAHVSGTVTATSLDASAKINANQINSGVLTGMFIRGGDIRIGDLGNDDYNFAVDTYGNLTTLGDNTYISDWHFSKTGACTNKKTDVTFQVTAEGGVTATSVSTNSLSGNFTIPWSKITGTGSVIESGDSPTFGSIACTQVNCSTGATFGSSGSIEYVSGQGWCLMGIKVPSTSIIA